MITLLTLPLVRGCIALLFLLLYRGEGQGSEGFLGEGVALL